MSGPTRNEWRPYRPDTPAEAVAVALVASYVYARRAARAVKGWLR